MSWTKFAGDMFPLIRTIFISLVLAMVSCASEVLLGSHLQANIIVR